VVAVEIPEFVLARPEPDKLRPAKRWRILDETVENAPIHRINIAVAVVKAGLRSVLNRHWAPKPAPDHDVQDHKELWETLTRVESWNPRDHAPDFVTLQDGYLPAMPPRSRQGLPVVKGWHEHKSGFHLFMPVLQYGQQIAVERDQIQSFRSVRNLLREYMDNKDRNKKPISIAVFAPPGAGKSFAVEQIAQEVGLGDDPLEYNIAQFQNLEDLHNALHEVTEKSKKTLPLVFFDEFDSARDNQELGWLKFFLAPMQDGAFYSAKVERPVDIGRAVFIFAGGIYTSFEWFDPRRASIDEELGYVLSEEHQKRIERFKQAKGPDFISRLRGYIDIADANAEPGRSKHFARRAIQLRGLLEQLKFVTPGKWAKIDESIIYALLTVDRYRHGVRSMEAILRMCRRIDDYIQISSLPARAQLNMHVNAEEFFIRLHRGRSRAEDWIPARVKQNIEGLKKLPIEPEPVVVNLREIINNLQKGVEEGFLTEDASKLDVKLEVLKEVLKGQKAAVNGGSPPDGSAGLTHEPAPQQEKAEVGDS
jgi:hypothetical protein